MRRDGGGVIGNQFAVRRHQEIGRDPGQFFEAFHERLCRAQEAVIIRPRAYALLQGVHIPELARAVEGVAAEDDRLAVTQF